MYDTIHIGAGPAGLSAAIYGARYLMKQVVIGQLAGGMITVSHKVENYPGFLLIPGWELAQKFEEHAKSLGVEIVMDEVTEIEKKADYHFLVKTPSQVYETKTVVLATGLQRRKLNVPGESKLEGRGVSYCATCDGAFYRDKVVGVIGGSNAACEAASYLADVGRQVYLIYRRDKLRAEPADVKLVLNNDKIQVLYNTNVVELIGEQQLEKVKFDNPYNGSDELGLDGLFVEIGFQPENKLLANLDIELDRESYIKVDKGQRANVPGVYAAGDITDGSDKFQQVITAAAEGAIAVMSVYADLKKI